MARSTLRANPLMSTCFIADLHLSESHPEVTERFNHFLREEAPQHQTLYILGDLFEIWIGDDLIPNVFSATLQQLHTVSEQGVTIRIQHGNRDFLLGKRFEQLSGTQIIRDPYPITLDSASVLLTHGDQLCTEDLDYQRYRAWIRHPAVTWLLRHLPQGVRQKIGKGLRQRSTLDKQQKSMEIMDVTRDAVDALMREWKSNLLIHGHTHRPAIHTFELDGGRAQRMVLGDWDSKKNILIYRDGQFIQQSW